MQKNPQPLAVVDLHGGGEPWLSKSTIRRRVLIQMFDDVASESRMLVPIIHYPDK